MTVAAVEPKIIAPVNRPGLVRRERLLGRLARTAEQPLILLVAPPGYGKTTALAQWAEQDGRDVAWVTVDEADNDPGRMLDHIGHALDGLVRTDPGPFEGGPAHGLTVPLLVRGIRERDRPVLIVLDDIHHLHRTPVPELLIKLATSLPPGSQLAVASRTVPSLTLGRLRAERRCAEFGVVDLAFDSAEAGDVVALAGVRLGDAELQRLVDRTEGWPAGVYLAAVAMRDRIDRPAAAEDMGGSDAYIVDFFRDELLAHQPPDTVRFLLRTAVLGQLSAGLCDAVLETTGSAARLAEIELRNLFLVPLDHHREWYRYHRLFAEALVAELRRREPGEEQRVLRRAAGWYEQHGKAEQAVAHWIAGGRPASAGPLVSRHYRGFIAAGRIATVRGWVEALGPEALEGYPPAALMAAWTYAVSGDTGRAHHFLLAAGRAEFAGRMPDGHTSLRSAVALLGAALGSLGVDRMVVDARRALELEPPGSPFHPLAAMVLGTAEVLAGSPEDGSKHLEQAALLGRETARLAAHMALAQLSLLHAERHEDAAADQCAESAHQVMVAANLHDDMTSVLTHLATAKADLRAGRRPEARHQLGTAVRTYLQFPPTAFPWLAVQAALVLGEVALELDDVAAARTRIEDARRHLARLLTEGVLRDRLQALSQAVARAGGRNVVPSAMALSAAEERVLRLLPTHLSLGEIADELHVSRNTVKSHVGAVYRKLHANTRTEAVSRARELGLLSA